MNILKRYWWKDECCCCHLRMAHKRRWYWPWSFGKCTAECACIRFIIGGKN